MLLAEAAAAAKESAFDYFDIFMLVLTLILLWAVIRQVKQRPRNMFALGFAVVSFLVFVAADFIMISGW
ncbi:DUF2759 family protein [Paenibacillus sp. ACRRX]|uniref:DUF2759 family protein n=1 Tax=unclassified Paenibacillus TaxID=185978 RepID=UPI001EF7309F|nr:MULTISPECIES: DUF2759 family protein [unclassified Paenibacillus]MCG7407954.1 DUF2759 family protein [Paenibacillus sp. ACRRX]MDK8181665.1 DUF2759 family protein [Paenibacillus sp. UMB4589-SE434]